MIEIRDLTKHFPRRRGGNVLALRGVSFDCRVGEIFGLLGRNGAGKTTTLRILATILSPTSGRASVLGHDVVHDGAAVRKLLGFQTGETRLYDRLTGREVLSYFGRLHDMPDDRFAFRLEFLRDRFELGDFLDQRIGTLSSGQTQRLSLARAMIHDPAVLVLDEPTTGLDILAARETLTQIRSLRDEGRTILLSTHNLSEVEKVCDRVGILDEGRLLACEPVRDLADRYHGDLEQAFVDVLESAPGVEA